MSDFGVRNRDDVGLVSSSMKAVAAGLARWSSMALPGDGFASCRRRTVMMVLRRRILARGLGVVVVLP